MTISGKKILVTGGAGFIGSHIVENLVAAGANVTVYDNFSSGKQYNLSNVITSIRIIDGDILDYDKLNHAMKGVEIVSHHAAQLEIFLSSSNPYRDLEINTIGTLNILRSAKKHGIEKIINASSACVYGQVNGLTNEGHPTNPNWQYGVSKLAAEKYCNIFSQYHNLPVVNLRYGIVYGEREWYRRVLSIYIKRAVENKAMVVFGEGSQIRDFIYVGDVVDIHTKCLLSPICVDQTYNVGTGKPTSIIQLAKIVIDISGKKIDILHENTPEGAYSRLVPDKRRNPSELKIMLLDITKARQDLNWGPAVSLEEGVRREMIWYTENSEYWDKIKYSS